MYPRDYRGMDVVSDTRQEKRKGCSCIGILVTLIIIGVIFLVVLALNSDVFWYGVSQEVRDSAFNDLLSIVVILIALVPIVIIITRYLNRQQLQMPL
jgi:archaellum biogenesis protein FlaJ (TadC family)